MRPGAGTPLVYTTCMHALRMHFLPATGLYGLARGLVAAAQRFEGSHAPYVVFFTLVFARSKPWLSAARAQARRPQRPWRERQ